MKTKTFGTSKPSYMSFMILGVANKYSAQAIADYRDNRENGADSDTPRDEKSNPIPFPNDGSYVSTPWEKLPRVYSIISYREGPKDKEWMDAKDRNYVFRLLREGRLDTIEPNLKDEVPALYAQIQAIKEQLNNSAISRTM